MDFAFMTEVLTSKELNESLLKTTVREIKSGKRTCEAQRTVCLTFLQFYNHTQATVSSLQSHHDASQ